MKTLIQGFESAEQFEVLLQLTGITSEDKKNALRAHLVEGLLAEIELSFEMTMPKHLCVSTFYRSNYDGINR